MMVRRTSIATAAGAALMAASVLAVPASAAPPSIERISCTTTHGSTGGSAECTVTGSPETWRARAHCRAQTDQYTPYIYQRSGTTRQYVPDCRYEILYVTVEVK